MIEDPDEKLTECKESVIAECDRILSSLNDLQDGINKLIVDKRKALIEERCKVLKTMDSKKPSLQK